jgi:hypothetical protein
MTLLWKPVILQKDLSTLRAYFSGLRFLTSQWMPATGNTVYVVPHLFLWRAAIHKLTHCIHGIVQQMLPSPWVDAQLMFSSMMLGSWLVSLSLYLNKGTCCLPISAVGSLSYGTVGSAVYRRHAACPYLQWALCLQAAYPRGAWGRGWSTERERVFASPEPLSTLVHVGPHRDTAVHTRINHA